MEQTATVVGLLSFGWLTMFQLLLASGLPLGRMAWGGANRILPPNLRIASLISAAVAGFAWVAFAQADGIVSGIVPDGWLGPVFWALSGLFGASFLANLFGAHGVERAHGVPLTLLCGGSSLALAIGG